MKACLIKLRRALFCLIAAGFVCAPLRAATPVYREVFSFTNQWVRAKAFNNARDVLASYYDTVQGVDQEVFGIIRTNGNLRLTPVTNPTVQSVAAGAMSQRRDDGGLYVAGTATCTDGYTRACVWNVAPDGTYVFTLAQIITLPPDSQTPSAKESSYAAAISKFGVIVGGADSHVTSVPTRWTPPYTVAETFRLSSYAGCNFVDIDDNGNMLANSVQFDRGTTNEHAAAALVKPDGAVLEIPALEKRTDLPPGDNGYFYNNEGQFVRGEWVAGRGIVGTSFRAFAWKIGMINAIRLLPPDAATANYATAVSSMNSSQQILGNIEGWPALWQRENDNFAAHYLADLIPADSFFPTTSSVNEEFINDAGEIALTFNGAIMVPAPPTLRIYAPVSDGIVQVVPYVPYATEGWGTMDFTLRLTRASGNDLPVTAYYRTLDGSAKEGVNYIAQQGSVTWAAGDSDDKYVHVNLIDNLDFDNGKSFSLELTSATEAQSSAHPTATGTIVEPFSYITAQNSIYTPDAQGVAVLQGPTNVIVRLQRLGGSDGTLTLTNFVATDVTATNGIDYTFPTGLTLEWAPGETNVKTISIPLLQTEEITSSRLFMVAAQTLAEGPSTEIPFSFGVIILPSGSSAFPTFSPNTTLANGSLQIHAMAAQGATIQLLSAPTLTGPWNTIEEQTSIDGILDFKTPVDHTPGAQFFQLTQKQN